MYENIYQILSLKYKKAFTLAEIMIALVVIGVITSILLPVAFNSVPDENVMKFKKGNATLAKVINELVSSDKYYCNGDLGIKSDCKKQIFSDNATRTYFCETFADLLSTKSVNCYKDNFNGSGPWLLSNEGLFGIATGEKMKRTVTKETIEKSKEEFDKLCQKAAPNIGSEIVTTDDITYFQASTGDVFGSQLVSPEENSALTESILLRYFSPPSEFPANYSDENGFDISYKVFCMDVDGIPDDATETDCKNECPFGYGIRADGKILTGKRADEWLEKNIQDKD